MTDSLECSDPISPDERLMHLVHRTSGAGRLLRRLLADLAATAGLSDAELLLVWLCTGQSQGWVQVDLAIAVGLSPAQTSGMVERLRQRGLIEMQRLATDRRRQVWRATTTGAATMDALRPELARLAIAIDQRLDAGEQDQFSRVCKQIAEVVAAISADSSSSAPGRVHSVSAPVGLNANERPREADTLRSPFRPGAAA